MISSEFQAWLGQVPWNSLAILAVIVAVFVWNAVRKSGNQKKLRAKIEAGAVVVDVRTKEEYTSGHFGGALHIPLDTLGKQLKKIGAHDRPVIVYCASGARAGQAASLLRSAGYSDVTNAGGLANMPR
jgi:phage shock protein E